MIRFGEVGDFGDFGDFMTEHGVIEAIDFNFSVLSVRKIYKVIVELTFSAFGCNQGRAPNLYFVWNEIICLYA